MKRDERFSIIIVLFIFFAGLLTGCGGSSGGGSAVADNGSGGAAKGTFKKSIVYNDTTWATLFNDYPTLRFHLLYRAEDINGSGNISALRYRLAEDLLADVTCNNTTIKIGHTSAANLTTTFADAIETGKGSFVTVLDNAILTIPAATAGSYIEIPLPSAFNYNGVDNLLIEISRSSACSGDVVLTAGSGLGYDATLKSIVSDTAVGGSKYDWNMTVSFQFSGGDNEVIFPGGALDIPPFSDISQGKVQILYTPSEINGSGPISGIGFQMSGTSLENQVTYTLKLGHSSTLLSTTFSDNFNLEAPLTVADNVSFTIPAGIPGGEYFWVPIPDGTFTYNGTDLLLLEIDVSAATEVTTLVCNANEEGRRAIGDSGEILASAIDSHAYNTKFRFKGAPVQIMPKGNVDPTFVLGGYAGTGAAQIQSLYKTNLVGSGGVINSINVRLRADSVEATIPDYRIYMGVTAKNVLDVFDTYSSNMELNSTLVFDGSFDIPAGLKAGDWLTIPLQTGFTYNPTQNMTVLFMADSASPGNNPVSGSSDTNTFPTHAVGRNDNAASVTGVPEWDYDGLVDLQLNFSK